jgi:hypothetical protein
MEDLSRFIGRITQAIPCYPQPRGPQKMGLKKNNTDDRQTMKLLAVVTELSTEFRINVKEWLASDECKRIGKLGCWGYGREPDGTIKLGLIFYVKKGSTGQDYRNALRCLTLIRSNPDL